MKGKKKIASKETRRHVCGAKHRGEGKRGREMRIEKGSDKLGGWRKPCEQESSIEDAKKGP